MQHVAVFIQEPSIEPEQDFNTTIGVNRNRVASIISLFSDC